MLDPSNDYEELAQEQNIALANFRRKKLSQTGIRGSNGNIKYLTFDEASYLAKVSRSMINKWADKGKFTVIKLAVELGSVGMNLRTGWSKEIWKGVCNNMASIRERNGKFNVIYSYTNEKGERKQKWETYETKAEAKRRKKEIEYKKRWDHLSSANAKHWTSSLQNMLHCMEKKTGRFLRMKEMSLLSTTIFFRSLVMQSCQKSIPDSSKDIIRVF